MNRVILVLSMAFLSASALAATNLNKEMNSLGDNQAVVERAKALDPKNKVHVVQSRLVDRNLRLELGVNAGLVGGGDTYLRSQNVGGNLDFHITPKWSLGLRYEHYYNSLTDEGKAFYSDALARQNAGPNPDFLVPQIDPPQDTGLAVVSWYPVYGKLNFFSAIAHFDLYALAGYGKTFLASGAADTYAGGGGFGIWWNQYLATRLECRYQTYKNGLSQQIDSVVGTISMGILL